MSHIRGGVCVVAVLSLAACDNSSTRLVNAVPAAPRPVPPPPPPPALFDLSGVVRVAGIPLAGSRVALLDGESERAFTVTDDRGSYIFAAVEHVPPSGVLLSASRAEYFTETRYVPLFQNQTLDFDLVSATYVAVGEVVRSPVGDAFCASLGYGGAGGSQCRRFAIKVPTTGILEVSVSSTPAEPFDLSILTPDGTIAVYTAAPRSPLRATVGVTSGLTYQIDVVHISSSTREFELATTLR